MSERRKKYTSEAEIKCSRISHQQPVTSSKTDREYLWNCTWVPCWRREIGTREKRVEHAERRELWDLNDPWDLKNETGKGEKAMSSTFFLDPNFLRLMTVNWNGIRVYVRLPIQVCDIISQRGRFHINKMPFCEFCSYWVEVVVCLSYQKVAKLHAW